MKHFAPLLIAVGALMYWPAGQLHAQNRGAPRAEPITLNFTNADIAEVARTMGVLTGRSVVVDPRVRGTVNLTTEKPVSPALAYDQFLAVLRLQGFAVVETAGLYKVVPEADAKLQGGSVTTGSAARRPGAPGNQIVTQIFRLNFETANNLVPVLRPLISPNNTINVNPGNNSLVITDYSDNLQRIARIIAVMDVPSASDLEIISLKHAIASDIVPLLTRLMEPAAGAAGQGQADTSFRTAIMAEPRTNAIIVRAANPARTALARALVERLDQPESGSNGASGNIHVVYLKNADANKLAATLRAAISGEARGPATAAPAALSQGNAAPPAVQAPGGPQTLGQSSGQGSTGGQIQADTATNSLIISAPEPQYRQLRAVIDRLDSRRAQVYVESLIVEINADKAAEFGVQWQAILRQAGGAVAAVGTNFGTGASNLVTLATQAAAGTFAPAAGANLAVLKRNGAAVLGALVRFLEQSGDGNILSTPNLVTLDNEEAKIVIGQNVPFVTGQFTNTGGGNNGAVNPFQTIERKDVGLTLRVRPQISENGTVKLQIFQEVSSVQASSINSPSGLITNKRSIESSVLVDDGAVIVLGGLLQDEYSRNQEKVPVLGDLPFFGPLFRSETRSRKKTNLMVFLRPLVIRDTQQGDALSLDRYDIMRGLQLSTQPPPSGVLNINEAPVLPQRMPAEPPPEDAVPVPRPLGQ